MPDKEATARIKINKLLEAAGWRFFADGDAPANIRLEPSVKLKSIDLEEMGGWRSHDMVLRYSHLSAEHLLNHAERIARPGNHSKPAVPELCHN